MRIWYREREDYLLPEVTIFLELLGTVQIQYHHFQVIVVFRLEIKTFTGQTDRRKLIYKVGFEFLPTTTPCLVCFPLHCCQISFSN
jgi:hypothetical protein